jgi:sulfate permease, SulP family
MAAHFQRDFVPKSWDFLKRYNWGFFKSDLLAGVTVGIVALPLAMAFAIAAGLTPERGLYTAIIAGFLISLLGGSRFQIGGPTGAFVVIIYDVVFRIGYSGLVIVTLMAGILLLICAFFRLGNLIKYIPYPLITGFTAGIAVVIFSSQIKDFFGLQIAQVPADFIPKWAAFFKAFPTLNTPTFMVAGGTLALILVIRKFFPVLPWGIASVAFVSLLCWVFKVPVETIATRFGEIKSSFPRPSLDFHFSFNEWHLLFSDAVTIAFLAGIESLLSAVVADGMGGSSHRSNCELMAQGVANIGSVLFGGIPATGAIARTATNIKAGAKTPLAGMIHSFTLLLILLFFAPIISQIPLASLSAVLVMVAWNMSEAERFRNLFKAPLGDIAVLLTTFFLTILVDLTVAVQIGMILAAFFFMKRMGDVSKVISFVDLEKDNIDEEDTDTIQQKQIPQGVEIFEITGPFFFGVADSLKRVLSNLEFPPKVFILRMLKVPLIDASGMHALKEFHLMCKRDGTILLLSGVRKQVMKSLKKFGVIDLICEENVFLHIDPALKRAVHLLDVKKT